MPQSNASEEFRTPKQVSPISKRLLKRKPRRRGKWQQRIGVAALFVGALATAGIVKLALNPTPIALVIEDFIPTSYHPKDPTPQVSGYQISRDKPARVPSTSHQASIAEPAQVSPEHPSEHGLITRETPSQRGGTDEILDSYVCVEPDEESLIGEVSEECPDPMNTVHLTSKPVSTEFRFNELIADCREDVQEVAPEPKHFEPTIDALMEEYLSEELAALRTDYDRKLEALRLDGGKNKLLGRDYYESIARLSELSHRAEGVPMLVHNVVKELTTDRDVYLLISSAGESWLKWSKRDSSGIVLAGRVVAGSEEDNRVTIRIRNKAKTRFDVDLVNSLSASPGDEVIILGRIVEMSSGQEIRGYGHQFKDLAAQAR